MLIKVIIHSYEEQEASAGTVPPVDVVPNPAPETADAPAPTHPAPGGGLFPDLPSTMELDDNAEADQQAGTDGEDAAPSPNIEWTDMYGRPASRYADQTLAVLQKVTRVVSNIAEVRFDWLDG